VVYVIELFWIYHPASQETPFCQLLLLYSLTADCWLGTGLSGALLIHHRMMVLGSNAV